MDEAVLSRGLSHWWPRVSWALLSLSEVHVLCNTITRTGDQDLVVFTKGLGTRARDQEGVLGLELGFCLVPRLPWPLCVCTLLRLLEGPLFFCPPGDFLLKLIGTSSGSTADGIL